MKKSIAICAIVLMTFCQKAIAQKSESWYRNYFKENIEKLDPIEGIYSVDAHVISRHGITEESRKNSRVVIIKEGYYYVQHRLGNETEISVTKYNRIGETMAYDYNVKWNCCSETANGRIYMESLFGFEYVVTLPASVIRATLRTGKEYAHLFRVTGEYRFIKDYPTRSMYEDVIAAAQRKREEESKPTAWSGTGWAIGNGYVVTNSHVAENARMISIKGINGDMNNGYKAEVVATDKVNDIAVLRVIDSRFGRFGTIPYSVSSRMADVGEDVFVLGYPLTQALGNEIKLTNGIISSRTGYQGDVACYQMSAPIQPGNSGGPMFDNKGNVIGIVVAGVPGAENVGYAIKISYLNILIESAGLNIKYPASSTIATLSLAEKVKKVKNFVFYIECSK